MNMKIKVARRNFLSYFFRVSCAKYDF